MTNQGIRYPSFPDFPSQYWSTLSHQGHLPPTNLHLQTDLEHLSDAQIDSNSHNTTFFGDFATKDFAKSKKLISPSTRTCSSLLSEMLRPATESHASSPVTTHVETLSEHGSFSTHCTPPIQASPPRALQPPCIKLDCAGPHLRNLVVDDVPANDSCTISIPAPKPVRHISFGCAKVSPVKKIPAATGMDADCMDQSDRTETDIDHSNEATPIAKRNSDMTLRSDCSSHNQSRENGLVKSDQSQAEPLPSNHLRPRAIRFAGSSQSELKSVTSSRRSSCDDAHAASIANRATTKNQPIHSSADSSPVMLPRAGPATCKSTLDAMLQKEAIAKVIETVPEEEDEDDDDDDDEEEEEGLEFTGISDDEDQEVLSILELDSDDDGYHEDIESEDDEDIYRADVYPLIQADASTPRISLQRALSPIHKSANETSMKDTKTHIYRTAPPSESDLPDTTDFAPGNMDEDQPACIAFDMAIKDREARRCPAKPSDIDPTFPDSGSEDDIEEEQLQNSLARTTNGHPVCRSPPMHQKSAGRSRYFSPPLVKATDVFRARSLPRRYLTSRKDLYAPKPQRAVTIKQSNEQRAQRRREKKEVRQNARRAKQEVDHNGHEKMKVHCLSRKKLIAAENPCVIRPIMSI